MALMAYERDAAVRYAHAWAFGRNPRYYDFELLGGDCTNFVSQCLYAGSGVMDYTPTFGWYYISPGSRAPAWTGVEYLYNYLTRAEKRPGPAARDTTIFELEPGDLVQMSFDGLRWQHCPIIVSIGEPRSPETILVAAHSENADNRPLATYSYVSLRFLHIIGVFPA